MMYKEYAGHHTYVVQRYTGFGLQESPHIEGEVMGSFESEDEAKEKQVQLTISEPSYNPSWQYVNFFININTLTNKGKQLLLEFEKSIEEGIKSGRLKSIYEKIPFLDDCEPLPDQGRTSPTFYIIDISK